MPAPITRDSLPLLFRIGLRKNFRDKWMMHKEQYSQFLNVGSTGETEVHAALMTGPSRFLEIGDGEPIPLDDLKMSGKVTAVDREFARGFAITKRTISDDKYAKAKSGAGYLGDAAQLTKEYQAAALLDDFFSGTTYKGYDGLSFGNANHTYINAPGVISNVTTTELSVTGVTQMVNLFMQMKNHNGDPIVMRPDKMFIGNDATQLHRAQQILGSQREPFSVENQDNALNKNYGGITPIPLVYVASTLKYYMVDSKYNDLHFLMREAPAIEDWYDERTRSFIFQSAMRFIIWGVDWRGWAGANVTS